MHFEEEKNGEYIPYLKYSVPIFLDFKLLPCSLCSVFFWVISLRLSSKNQRFGTPYLFRLQEQVDEESISTCP